MNGGPGNDTLNGGDGWDVASYIGDTAGVTVDLGAGTAVGAASGNDTLSGIEQVYGGSGNDTFTGTAGDDAFNGYDGDDTVYGTAGNDFYAGSRGTDTLNFASDTAGVMVDLRAETASGSAIGNDVVQTFENVIGGSGGDSITGSSAANILTGGAGGDTLTGSGGSDIFRYTDTSDSTSILKDIITDFSTADANEDIWLDGFTSNADLFSFLGTGAFTNTGNVQARMATNGLLEIDADGDGAADMEITLTSVNVGTLDASDFTVT